MDDGLRGSKPNNTSGPRLQIKKQVSRKPEKASLQEYASEVSASPLSNCARSNLFTVFRGRPDGKEIQKAVRMTDVQDLKSALLYAPIGGRHLKPVAKSSNPSEELGSHLMACSL
ncbi:hypothetical protein TNCV_2197401 [Trichonephila clavipes]|nr:hypothetical protein TNCV_2197401 [Trichonephila clavipes]